MKIPKILIVILPLLFGSYLMSQAPVGTLEGQWRFYGGDPGSSRYSRLTQINRSNVRQLRVAWEWKLSSDQIVEEKAPRSNSFEATPLMIDDVLYLPTPYYHATALDAKTGKQIWDFDTGLYAGGPPHIQYGIVRTVASWSDGNRRRIFMAARGRLFALDAETGKLIPSFGQGGVVDVRDTLDWKIPSKNPDYFNTSGPFVINNVVILGSATSGPGDVQAFDVRTGKQVWIFHTVPLEGEFGHDSWEGDSWKYAGGANAWPPLTFDEKRGLVYLLLTSPSEEKHDYYGGERKGNTLFGDSLVCLDANSGQRKWHFQTVHHDIWDYDGAMGANLLTINVDGKAIDAVAAVSKTGFTYVFDRMTGQPVWPIEERPVPQTDVLGEKASATQPFPTKPPAFAKQGFNLEDVVDFTPEIKAAALEKVGAYRPGPIFNPPSIQGTFMIPSNVGGAEWGGAAADPEKGILYVRAENILQVIKITREFSDEELGGKLNPAVDRPRDSVLLTPKIADVIPINKPPYSTITAIDLNKGEILWQVPNGDMPEIRNHPLLKGLSFPPTGVISRGMGFGRTGPMVTAGGLLFIGPGDQKLYARDKDNGDILWTADLKNDVAGTPMTYRTSTGQQFLVVATGVAKDSALVAFSLP